MANSRRFYACCEDKYNEFVKLAKSYGVKLTDVYATPNALWMEYEFGVDTIDEDILAEFDALENR